MSDRRDTFAARLARARRENGLTQEQASDLIPVSLRAYQKWEAGTIPHPGNLQRLADVFDVQIRDLTGQPDPDQLDRIETALADLARRLIAIERVLSDPLGTDKAP